MADAQTSLFENRMLMSLLSGAGASVAGEGSFAASLNPLIQQTIGAQSQASLNQRYMKMLASILRGEVPDGGKLTMDKDGMTIKAPKSALEGPIQQPQPGTFTTTPAPAPIPAPSVKPTDIPGQEWQQFLNPLSSQLPNITASDVAGLTPQDVSRALGGALSTVSIIEGIKSKKFSALVDQMYRRGTLGVAREGLVIDREKLAIDRTYREGLVEHYKSQARTSEDKLLIDKMYKEGLLEYYSSLAETGGVKAANAQIKRLTEYSKLFREAPLEVPGMGKITLDEWDKLSTDVKAYSYYAFDAQQRDEEVMPFNEWKQQSDPGAMIEYYNLAKEDPEFKEFFFKAKTAAAPKITIGERADIKHMKYFTDPEGLSDDLSRYIESNTVQDALIQLEGREKTRETIRLTADFIRKKITATGGEVTDTRMDGRTRIWTVKWPNGAISEVRHAF